MVQKVVTLQRSGVGIVTVLRKMEAGLQALSTKDLFWKVAMGPNTAVILQPKGRDPESVVPGLEKAS